MILDRWNGMNFPFVASVKNGKVIIEKYMLDDLEGDVNLSDTKKYKVLVINENENPLDVLYKLQMYI